MVPSQQQYDPDTIGPEVWATTRRSATLGAELGGINRERYGETQYAHANRIPAQANSGAIRGMATAAIHAGHKPTDAEAMMRPDLGGKHITMGARLMAETMYRLLFHFAVTPEKGRVALGLQTNYAPITQHKLAELLRRHTGLRGIAGKELRHRSTISRYCKELVEAKLLIVTRRAQVRSTGHPRANLYKLAGALKVGLAHGLLLWHAMCDSRNKLKAARAPDPSERRPQSKGRQHAAAQVARNGTSPPTSDPPEDVDSVLTGLSGPLRKVAASWLGTRRQQRKK